MKFFAALLLSFFCSVSWAAPITISIKDQPLGVFLKTIYTDILKQSYVLAPALAQSTSRVNLELVFDDRQDLLNRLPSVLHSLSVVESSSGGVSFLSPGQPRDFLPSVPSIPSVSPSFSSPLPVIQPMPELPKLSWHVYKPQNLSAKALCAFFTSEAGKGAAGSFCTPAGPSALFRASDSDFDALTVQLAALDLPSRRVEITTALAEVSLGHSKTSGISVLSSILGASVNFGPALASGGFTFASKNFSLVLDALGTDSRVVHITSPSGVVQSGSKLDLAIGDRQPTLSSVSTSATGLATQSIQYQQAGVILSVTPTIVGGDRVDLSVESEVSSFSQTTTGISNSPTISQRKISTSLVLGSGQAVVLGGLRSSKDQAVKNSLFGLSTGSSLSEASTDLVLLVYARIIDDENRGIGGVAPDVDKGAR